MLFEGVEPPPPSIFQSYVVAADAVQHSELVNNVDGVCASTLSIQYGALKASQRVVKSILLDQALEFTESQTAL